MVPDQGKMWILGAWNLWSVSPRPCKAVRALKWSDGVLKQNISDFYFLCFTVILHSKQQRPSQPGLISQAVLHNPNSFLNFQFKFMWLNVTAAAKSIHPSRKYENRLLCFLQTTSFSSRWHGMWSSALPDFLWQLFVELDHVTELLVPEAPRQLPLGQDHARGRGRGKLRLLCSVFLIEGVNILLNYFGAKNICSNLIFVSVLFPAWWRLDSGLV